MLNNVVLIGRTTRDPDLRYTPNGKGVANFTLAVDRGFPGSDGERQADFFDCQCWGKTAENMAQYVTKGQLIAVQGRLQSRSYETQDGQKRKVIEVVADVVKFLERKKDGSSSPPPKDDPDGWESLGKPYDPNSPAEDDDIVPF